MIFIKRETPTKVEIFKGKEWVWICLVKAIKIWGRVNINIQKGAFKAKTVDGPIRLFVDINGSDGYVMKIAQFYSVTSSTSNTKPVPVPSHCLSCSHPRANHLHVSLTPEIAPWVPISTFSPYTPSTEQQRCRLHLNYMPLHRLNHSDEYPYYKNHVHAPCLDETWNRELIPKCQFALS